MNWKRILIFVMVLYAATFAVGFAGGFVHAFIAGVVGVPRAVTLMIAGVTALSVICASVLTFFLLARLQADRPYAHAVAVAAIAYAAAFFVNVMIMGMPVGQWAPSALLLIVSLAVGTPLGIALRRRRDHDDALLGAST